MANQLLETFTFVSYLDDTEYQIKTYYDDATYAITYTAVNANGEVRTFANLNKGELSRGHEQGDRMFGFCTGTSEQVFYASYFSPFAYHHTIANSETCEAIANDPSCDLAWLAVEHTSESAEFASDGTITATANTTNGPVEFRLDEGVWGEVGTFAGLAPNVYLLQGRDALGCLIRRTVEVKRYRQVLIETPARALPSGNVSRWSAVFNPVVFKYQRKDYFIGFVKPEYGTFLVVYLPGELTEAEKAGLNGAVVYLKTEDFEITGTAFDAFYDDREGETGISLYVASLPVFEPTAVQGYANILSQKIGHRFVTEITFGDQPQKQKLTARHSANLQGLARADISKYLKGVLRAEDRFNYDVRNWRDLNLAQSYTVRFREEWDAGAGEWTEVGDPFYVTYSALQLGNKYGSNMAEYVPFYLEPVNSRKAKFLNEFARPVMYENLPFDLAFIYGEELVGQTLYVKEEPLTLNRQPTSGPIDRVLLNETGGALLNEDGSWLLASKGIAQGEGALAYQLGVNRLTLTGLYPAGTKFLDVYLYYKQGETEVRVTEIKTVEIRQKPCGETRYFKWLNLLGGWSYALFDFKIEHALDVKVSSSWFAIFF